MLEGPDLGLVCGQVAQHVGAQSLLANRPQTQAPPHIAILVPVQAAMPLFTRQAAAPEV